MSSIFKIYNTIPERVIFFPPTDVNIKSNSDRSLCALVVRNNASCAEYKNLYPKSFDNGDEELYPNKIASYSKGLQHNTLGEVLISSWNSLKRALDSKNPSEFEDIQIGGSVKLTNPQAGLAYDLEGQDSHTSWMPPAPTFASDEEAGEILENYWMAICRDVPFKEYDTNPLIAKAITDLNTQTLEAPKIGGRITTSTIFRGIDPTGESFKGPYISQFLYLPITFGAVVYEQKSLTYLPGSDYLTNYDEWISIQNGNRPSVKPDYDNVRRYLRNGRDLSEWVHFDHLFQAYLQALNILLALKAPLSKNNPYNNSTTQGGFATFGAPHVCSLVTEVANKALKCAWFQKWYVHLRLRPEEFGGRVHNNLVGKTNYPISNKLNVNNEALSTVFNKYGTYLLPMAYVEGCPTHPAYAAGHQTVAAACVTILKAFFDEDTKISSLTQPKQASDDGLSLEDYLGEDKDELTVGSELNKLCSNVGVGRNFAGVHWRTDANDSLELGENLAISVLRGQKQIYNENFAGWTFTKFNGEKITIN